MPEHTFSDPSRGAFNICSSGLLAENRSWHLACTPGYPREHPYTPGNSPEAICFYQFPVPTSVELQPLVLVVPYPQVGVPYYLKDATSRFRDDTVFSPAALWIASIQSGRC